MGLNIIHPFWSESLPLAADLESSKKHCIACSYTQAQPASKSMLPTQGPQAFVRIPVTKFIGDSEVPRCAALGVTRSGPLGRVQRTVGQCCVVPFPINGFGTSTYFRE